MDDLPAKLKDVRERIAQFTKLLEECSAASAAARALLSQESTHRPRRTIESELLEAEMNLRWIRPDLAALVSRERLLEADLGAVMAEDVEAAAAETARAAKAAKAKGTNKRAEPPGGREIDRAADDSSQEDPATAGT